MVHFGQSESDIPSEWHTPLLHKVVGGAVSTEDSTVDPLQSIRDLSTSSSPPSFAASDGPIERSSIVCSDNHR